jgi:hypothetical protein
MKLTDRQWAYVLAALMALAVVGGTLAWALGLPQP